MIANEAFLDLLSRFTRLAGEIGPVTLPQRLALCSIYAPYLIIPAAFAWKLIVDPYTGKDKKTN